MVLKFQKPCRITPVSLLSISLLLLIFSFNACQQSQEPQQQFLHQIDSLQQIVYADSLAFQELREIPYDSLVRRLNTIQQQISPADPLSESQYASVANALSYLRQLQTESDPFLKEISFAAQQLRNLRYDVSQQIPDSLTTAQYLKTEASAVKQIEAKTDYFLNRFNAQLLLIETLENNFQAEKD